MPHQSRLSAFIKELRRRKVFRVLALYAAAAFIILQVLDGILEVLTFPEWVGKVVVAGLVLGFPLAAILGWIFDITSHGIVRTPEGVALADGGEGSRREKGEPVSGGRSIAVLPFNNMSSDAEQDYFCDGMVEDIIDTLTKVPHLDVVSRLSTFAFKGKTDDIRDIGQQLGVGTVLEGSVRKSGDQLRITAQLIDVSSGYHLWSERYDRKLEDVFAIQDEIARNIVRSMEGVLTEEEFSAISRPATDNVEAYDFYLRGREFFYQMNMTSLDYAIEMFERATRIDPNYARAFAGLADCHSLRYLYYGGKKKDLEAARTSSRKALDLDADLAESHVSYGWALSNRKNNSDAEEEFELALRLNPNLFEAYFFYARACWSQGKMQKAARLFEQASDARPEDYQCLLLLAGVYEGLGETTKAKEAHRRGLEIATKHLEWHPNDPRAWYLGAAAHVRLGDTEKGLDWAERALKMGPDDPSILYNVACSYALAGEDETALKYLERVVTAGYAQREWMQNDHDLSSLHKYPQFQKLLDTMKFEE